MSLSYLKSQLYDNAIENFHTFLYIYRAVRLRAKANEFNYFLLYSTLNSDQFDNKDFI